MPIITPISTASLRWCRNTSKDLHRLLTLENIWKRIEILINFNDFIEYLHPGLNTVQQELGIQKKKYMMAYCSLSLAPDSVPEDFYRKSDLMSKLY